VVDEVGYMNALNDAPVMRRELVMTKIEERRDPVAHILEVAVGTWAESQSVLQTSQKSHSEEVVMVGLMSELRCR
jgi:hypothetical protein